MTVCIYCKEPTSDDRSKEHVVPLCLDADIMLPPGYVCTRCNNYFGTKLDPQLLQFSTFMQSIGHYGISGRSGSKKHLGGRYRFLDNQRALVKLGELKGLPSSSTVSFSMRMPHGENFKGHFFARCIHKIAFNIIALKEPFEFVMQSRFNKLRNYVRRAAKDEFWPYFYRSEGSINRTIECRILQDANMLFCALHILGDDFIVSFENVIDRADIPSGFEFVDGPKYWPTDIQGKVKQS